MWTILNNPGLIKQVTKLKLKQKQSEGIAEARSGRRSPVSVLSFCHPDLDRTI